MARSPLNQSITFRASRETIAEIKAAAGRLHPSQWVRFVVEDALRIRDGVSGGLEPLVRPRPRRDPLGLEPVLGDDPPA